MTEIRLAEDQMQELKRCILAGSLLTRVPPDQDIDEFKEEAWGYSGVLLAAEPKPEPAPGQIKASGVGWVDPPKPAIYGPGNDDYGRQRKPQIYGLTDAEITLRQERDAARYEVARLKQEIEQMRPNPTLGVIGEPISRPEALALLECQQQRDAARVEVEQLTLTMRQLKNETARTIAVQEAEIEQLKAQVPKEWLKVFIDIDLCSSKWMAFLRHDLGEKPYILFSNPNKAIVIQWCADHGFEVVE